MKRFYFAALLFISIFSISAITASADYLKTIYFDNEKIGKIPFEHQNHLAVLDNNCSNCHNSVFKIIRKDNPRYTMKQMEEKKSCGACHNKDNPRYPQLNACVKCHKVDVVTIDIPDFGSLKFSHPKHLEMFGCTDCHDSIFKAKKDENQHATMAQMEKGASCGACHEGKTAFSVKGDCVKCHEPKDLNLPASSIFSHSKHLAMSFACNECHNKLFVPGKNRKHASMTDMEKGKSCGACHDGSTAFGVKGDCAKCHSQIGVVNFKAFKARFDHKPHIAMFKCNDCHSSIFIGGTQSIRYTMKQMEKGDSCGACHDGKTAFTAAGNCEKCHLETPPDVVFTIKDAATVNFSHIKHIENFKCNDCHNSIFKAGTLAVRYNMSQMEKGSSCGACHDGKTAFGVKSCAKCHPVKEILFTDDARFSHDKHLEMYSCNDCHSKLFNPSSDNKRRTMQEMEKGLSCGGCHDASTAFSVKGDCDKCHKTVAKVQFDIKETGKLFFEHSKHKDMFKCAECHSSIFVAGKSSKRHTMADMEKGASCGTCHDGKTAFGVKNDCVKCHTVKKIDFKPGSAVFPHDIHIAAYNCKDCHPSIFIPAKGRNKHYSMSEMEKGESCGNCHDGKTAFSVAADCKKCHPGQPKSVRYELAQNVGNVDFSHKPHLDRGYDCKSCHYQFIPSNPQPKRWVMKEMEQGLFCGGCHGASMAFSVKNPKDCERCHLKESDWKPPANFK